VQCGRSIETTRRSALGDAADYDYCPRHSRIVPGPHAARHGTPRTLTLSSPKVGERDVCLAMLARLGHHGPVTIIAEKGYAGRQSETDAAGLGALIARPRRKRRTGPGPHLAPIRHRIESIFQTAKQMLGLEDRGARELHALRTRLAAKFLALTAAIALNHRLGRPPRNLTAYHAETIAPWNGSSRSIGPSPRGRLRWSRSGSCVGVVRRRRGERSGWRRGRRWCPWEVMHVMRARSLTDGG
jgi:DDE family transposase